MNFSDGSVYVGEFRNGKMHGKGQLTEAKGRIRKGRWIKGNLKKAGGFH